MSNLNGVFRAVVNVSKFHMVIIQPYRMSVSMERTAKKMLRLFTIQRKRTVKMTVNSSEITDIFLIIQFFCCGSFVHGHCFLPHFSSSNTLILLSVLYSCCSGSAQSNKCWLQSCFLQFAFTKKPSKCFQQKTIFHVSCLLITLQHYFFEKLLAIFVSCQTYLRHKLVTKIV